MLWRNSTFRHLAIGFSVMGFFGNGIAVWLPTFFIRSHDMATGELGLWMALAWGVAGAMGTYLGGALAARLAPGRESRQFCIIVLMYVLFSLISVATYLTPNRYLALTLMALSAFVLSSVGPPVFAALQGVVEPGQRAQATAVIFLFNNLIGLGLGPAMVGVVSDLLSAGLDGEALRYTLIAFSPGYLWVAWHFWRVSRTVESDMVQFE